VTVTVISLYSNTVTPSDSVRVTPGDRTLTPSDGAIVTPGERSIITCDSGTSTHGDSGILTTVQKISVTPVESDIVNSVTVFQ
jgi:hypothetical protein